MEQRLGGLGVGGRGDRRLEPPGAVLLARQRAGYVAVGDGEGGDRGGLEREGTGVGELGRHLEDGVAERGVDGDHGTAVLDEGVDAGVVRRRAEGDAAVLAVAAAQRDGDRGVGVESVAREQRGGDARRLVGGADGPDEGLCLCRGEEREERVDLVRGGLPFLGLPAAAAALERKRLLARTLHVEGGDGLGAERKDGAGAERLGGEVGGGEHRGWHDADGAGALDGGVDAVGGRSVDAEGD